MVSSCSTLLQDHSHLAAEGSLVESGSSRRPHVDVEPDPQQLLDHPASSFYNLGANWKSNLVCPFLLARCNGVCV